MKTLWAKYAMFGLTICAIHNHDAISMETSLDGRSKAPRYLPPLKPIDDATPRPEPKRHSVYQEHQTENSFSNSNAIFELEAFVSQFNAGTQEIKSH